MNNSFLISHLLYNYNIFILLNIAPLLSILLFFVQVLHIFLGQFWPFINSCPILHLFIGGYFIWFSIFSLLFLISHFLKNNFIQSYLFEFFFALISLFNCPTLPSFLLMIITQITPAYYLASHLFLSICSPFSRPTQFI